MHHTPHTAHETIASTTMRWYAVGAAVLLLALAGCETDGRQAEGQPAPTATAGSAEVRAVDAAQDVPPGRLLFVSGGDLWIWQAGATRRLTNEGHWSQPSFSPDGARIVCVQRDDSAADLVVLDAEGGRPTRLTTNSSQQPRGSYERTRDTLWAFYPSWSPDGREIVFASQYGPAFGDPATDYNLTLYRMPAAGGEREQIAADEAAQLLRPRYGPEGRLAFDRIVTGGEPASQVHLLRDGVAEPFPGAPSGSYDPAWSPDGQLLALAVRAEGGTDVYVLRAEGGGEPLRATTVGSARAPVFAPDGDWLAFIADGPDGFQLYAAPLRREGGGLSAGEVVQLTAGPGLDADSGVSWAR